MASQDGSKQPPHAAAEPAPDPDEDDLDDLDEMLDEFSNTKLESNPAPPPSASVAPEASGPGRPAAADDSAVDEAALEDEFAKQLEASMAEMVRELENNPEMAKQMEQFMSQMGLPADFSKPPPAPGAAAATAAGAAAATKASAPSSSAKKAAPVPAPSAAAKDEAFQDTIRRTIERMQESSDSATAAAAKPNPSEDDIMAQLMKELANSGSGADGDDSFSKMLLGMMEQLTNKEILYEPMKELDSKFPAWLEQNTGKLSGEELERYATQRVLVGEIVERFEREGYSDDSPEDREFIVERMQKMQASGAPPSELVGDTQAANDMMSELDQGCSQQ